MKQIVDKLNKIAKKIDESVEIPQTDLIIDSLDAITKAYGGTPNDSNLIVDKLEDIYNNIGSVPSGNIEITENGENINVAPFSTATVNVSGGSSYTELEFTYNDVDDVYESVLTVSEIVTASALGTLGFMRTDTNLDGALDLALNIPYVISAIYENEDVSGTYDIVMTATEYMGLGASGRPILNENARSPTKHLVFTNQK